MLLFFNTGAKNKYCKAKLCQIILDIGTQNVKNAIKMRKTQ